MGQRDIPLPGLGDGRAGYRAPVVARITKVSYRQLDHWTTKGLVSSSIQDAGGPGTHRLYSFTDIARVRMIRRLRDAGLSLQKITQVLQSVEQTGLELGRYTIVTDGTNVYACTDADEVLNLVMSGQAVISLAVKPLLEELRRDVVGVETEVVSDNVISLPLREQTVDEPPEGDDVADSSG